MAENYLKHLAEWITKREAPKKDRHLIAFLAVRDDVAAALAAGYTVKIVWADLQESKKITYCYETFLNYVNRYIRNPRKEKIKQEPASLPAKETAKKSTTLKSFVHNPNPKKEDLF